MLETGDWRLDFAFLDFPDSSFLPLASRVTITLLLRRRMREARPKARGIYFFNIPALSTVIDLIIISSGFSPLFFAFATALLMSFIIGSAARFGKNWSVANAADAFFPFTRSVTRRTLRGV